MCDPLCLRPEWNAVGRVTSHQGQNYVGSMQKSKSLVGLMSSQAFDHNTVLGARVHIGIHSKSVALFKWLDESVLRDIRGLIVLGAALACLLLMLSISVSWAVGVSQSGCNGPMRFDVSKLFGMVVIGPILESIVLALVALPFLKARPPVLAVGIGVVAGIAHGLVNGWLAVMTAILFAFCARAFQIGCTENGIWTGILRASAMHCAYNLPLFLVIQYCGA
jgi:hypothetical protein